MSDWKQVRRDVEDALLANGPMLKGQLYNLFPNRKRWEIDNAIRFIGCLSVSPGPYKPAKIYHPDSPEITPEMWPPVEVWLRRVFAKRRRVLSSQLAEASEKRGFSKSSYDQACNRLGIKSEKITEGPHAGHWAKVKK